MLDELWNEVRDIVQKTVIKTIPKKNYCKREKWLSEEVLQIAEKRRSKKQGRKGKIYTMSAEFQGKARRDKKAFFS